MRRVARALLLLVAGCGAKSPLEVPASATPADAGSDAPALACEGSPAQPTMLTTIGAFRDFDEPSSLTVAGSVVYYSVQNASNDPLAIFGVPIAGGAPERLVDGIPGCASSPFTSGQLVDDGARLYVADEEEISLCAAASVHVTRYDIAARATSTLPNPPTPTQHYVTRVRTTQDAGVLWLLADPAPGGTTLLVRWDGARALPIGEIPGFGIDFVVASDQAFVQAGQTLYATPLVDSHRATPLGPIDSSTFTFVGSNDRAVFYTPDGTTLVRRDALSGETRTIATDVDVSRATPADPMWADEAWVYFRRPHAPGPPQSLARVPESGGDPEDVWSDPDRRVLGVTTDACNVYWLAGPSSSKSQPAAVFARRR